MFVRAALACAVVFVLLTLGARALGNRQPAPEALARLHLADCELPCWLGISRGKTTYQQAIQRITAAYTVTTGIRLARGGDRYQFDTDFGTITFVADNGGIVRSLAVVLFGGDPALTMGDVVTVLGVPACRTNEPVTQIYYGSGADSIVFAAASSQGWRAKLLSINVISAESNPCGGLGL